MASTIIWLGVAIMFSAGRTAASDSAIITPEPSLPEPSAGGIIAAITPTSGGIGINPVSLELGDPSNYVLTDLGPNNPVISWDGDVYHYIEGHTNYLSLSPITTVVESQTTTMTSSVKVAVQTVTVGDASQQAVALNITFSEDIADALRNSADAAAEACSLNKRGHRKRFDLEASDVNGPLQGSASVEWWEALEVNMSQNAPQYLADALAVLKSQARKKETLVIVALYLAAYQLKHGPLGAVHIPPEGVGEPEKMTCDSSKPADQESPLCQDDDCRGDGGSQKCTTGPEKNCACLLLGVNQPPQLDERAWWDQQQSVIASVAANPDLLDMPTPSCSLNSAVTAFDGKPAETPASWCICNDSGTKQIYPTVDTPSSPRAYTSLPTTTIHPVVTATGASVTTCRMETNTITGIYSTPTVNTYCTCNDNSIYGVATLTTSGSTTKFTIEQEVIVPAAERFCSDNDHRYLRYLTGGTYGNVVSEYNSTGASKGGQLYLYAFLDKGCESPVFINKDDCIAAYQSIFDHCDVGAAIRQGGAASINCQWYNLTAEDECVGTDDSFLHPDKCDVGYPLGYEMWPMGFIPS
ncbi:hypothetical protein F5Y08DRAFT_338496 [Xylaria arbuscula]|nr:hypothetical protein F5Y08DRAFT_338496 [Xylaria arbuscula]